MRIGFIGLGNMGAPMARNLATAGHEVRASTRRGDAARAVRGRQRGRSGREGRDVVITMLPDGAILRAVCGRVDPGDAPRAPCCSTARPSMWTAPAPSREAGDGRGLLAVDAPVSGGVGGATAGTLTFMVGGTAAAFASGGAALRGHGHAGRALRRRGRRPGREDLQQHDPRRHDDRASARPSRWPTSSASTAQAMFDVVSTSSGECWSVNAYCPAPGRRARRRRPTTTIGRASRPN